MNTWPNFFIVGAPKAGTTSLHAHLRTIPGIYMSRIKEPNFFARVIVPEDHPVRPIRDTQKYLQLFSGVTTERVIGEASPTYLADPGAAKLIREVAPEARLLVSLRDPVERAYSHYLMMRNNGTASMSFLDELRRGIDNQENRNLALLRPDVGLYFAQLSRLLESFSRDRVQIVLFEEFVADVRLVLRQVLEFLEIDESVDQIDTGAERQFGEARGPLVRFLFGNRTISRLGETLVSPGLRKLVREKLLIRNAGKPVMDQDARAFLTEYYRDDVRRLAGLLERRLPWRNFSGASGEN